MCCINTPNRKLWPFEKALDGAKAVQLSRVPRPAPQTLFFRRVRGTIIDSFGKRLLAAFSTSRGSNTITGCLWPELSVYGRGKWYF